MDLGPVVVRGFGFVVVVPDCVGQVVPVFVDVVVPPAKGVVHDIVEQVVPVVLYYFPGAGVAAEMLSHMSLLTPRWTVTWSWWLCSSLSEHAFKLLTAGMRYFREVESCK